MIFFLFLSIFILLTVFLITILFRDRNPESISSYGEDSKIPCSSGRDFKKTIRNAGKIFKVIIVGIMDFIVFIITIISFDAPSINIYPDRSSIGYQDQIEIEGTFFPIYYTTKGEPVKRNGQEYQGSFLIDGENIVNGRYKITAAYRIFGFTLPFWESEIEYDVIDSSIPKFMYFECSTESPMIYDELHENIIDGNRRISLYWEILNDLYVKFENDLNDFEILSRVYINNGNGDSEESYVNYSRPSKIKIEFSDGESEIHTLNDTIETQTIKFNSIHKTAYIKISILEVFHGNNSNNIYISDIFFRNIVPAQ